MWHKALLGMTMFLVLTACGSEDTYDDQAQAGPNKPMKTANGATNDPPSVDSSPARFLPCGAMTKETAAEILGVSAEEVEYSFSDVLNMCSYRVSLTKSIHYALYAEIDSAGAAAEMTKVVNGLTYLAECRPVAGLGDAAVYCSGDKAERLLVRKGALWVDVQTPRGLDAKKRVARHVLN